MAKNLDFAEEQWQLVSLATSVADPDPHQIERSDPDPHRSDKLDPDPHQSDKLDPHLLQMTSYKRFGI
jgi:hypothetical protein